MCRLLTFCTLLCLLLLGPIAAAQDSLSQANEAWRQGDIRRAAQLFGEAAEAEPDSARRGALRVKQAQAYFNLKQRAQAEEALAAAFTDAPQIELLEDFYTADFRALADRVRTRLVARAAAPPAPAPGSAAPPPLRPPAPDGSLAALRQKLAMAIDNAALEALLAEVGLYEANSPPAGLPGILEIKADLLEQLGRSAEALDNRGRVMAMRALAQAVPGTPVVPFDALQSAQLLLAQGRPHDAEALMQGVRAVMPTCVEAFGVLGEALLESGKLDEAYSFLATATMSNDKPELRRLLGEVELRRGNLAQARDAFRRAAEAASSDDRAWAALGLVAARMDDGASAREALDRALQANGTLFEARVVRAQLALAEGQTGLALQHLQTALRQRPEDPWALGWLGVAHLLAGNAAAALDKLQPSPAEPPVFALARAEALRRTGKPAEALATLTGQHAIGAESGLLRARCLLDPDRGAEAIVLLEELAAEGPEDTRIPYLLGYALHRQRQWRQAADLLASTTARPGAPGMAKEGAALAAATLAAQELLDTAQAPPPPPPKR
ncbi:MAG: tetratricopeptide repeat protein [Acidobacteriota bacterium]